MKLRSAIFLTLLLQLPIALFAQDSFKGLVFPYREVTVSSPVEARIDSLKVREGDEVKIGDLMIELYSELQVLEAKRADSAVEMRKFEYESSKNLFEENVVSEDEALKARIELDLAVLTSEMAKEQVEVRKLLAPISGTVVERFKEVGERAQTTEPILTLVDLSQVYVQFYVRAEDLKFLSVGDETKIKFPALGDSVNRTGKIDFIDPRVDAASGLLRVRVKLANEDRSIKAGIRAIVELQSKN